MRKRRGEADSLDEQYANLQTEINPLFHYITNHWSSKKQFGYTIIKENPPKSENPNSQIPAQKNPQSSYQQQKEKPRLKKTQALNLDPAKIS